MPMKSFFPDLYMPECNLLSYLFPPSSTSTAELSDQPIWIDADDNSCSLSIRACLGWLKRLAVGLDKLRAADGTQAVKRGEVVLIFSPNSVFVPAVYLGVVGSARIFSGINPAYSVAEVAHQMQNAEAKLVLVHPSLLATALKAAARAQIPKERLFLISETENATQDGVPDWRTFLGTEEEAARYEWPALTGEESKTTIASINYSSGTTGLPKGVCVSHHNLIANTEQTAFMRDAFKPVAKHEKPAERWVSFLPLYHAYGQLFAMLMATKLRSPICIMKQFVFERYLQIIQDFKVTQLQAAPPIIVMLGKRPETAKYDLGSVIDVTCGAAPLSGELQNEVSKRFNIQINQGWGMTEATCSAMHVPGGLKDDTGSVGLLDPNLEAMLLDDDGKEVADGERGELFIRGPNVCMKYWKNEEATRETLSADGWLRTGDVAVAREGWFWIVDRKKELIKVNALQVAPAELEAVLLEHDDIADAAVVGLTLDANGNERPRAYVALKDTARQKQLAPAAIQEWIKPRVAKHKWLTGGVVFVDEVPKSPSGKILRRVMRTWAARDAKIEVDGSSRTGASTSTSSVPTPVPSSTSTSTLSSDPTSSDHPKARL